MIRFRRQRVYYVALVGLLLVIVGAWVMSRVAPARGQVDVTIHPAMTKGASSAAVTIIEFSDYQ